MLRLPRPRHHCRASCATPFPRNTCHPVAHNHLCHICHPRHPLSPLYPHPNRRRRRRRRPKHCTYKPLAKQFTLRLQQVISVTSHQQSCIYISWAWHQCLQPLCREPIATGLCSSVKEITKHFLRTKRLRPTDGRVKETSAGRLRSWANDNGKLFSPYRENGSWPHEWRPSCHPHLLPQENERRHLRAPGRLYWPPGE